MCFSLLYYLLIKTEVPPPPIPFHPNIAAKEDCICSRIFPLFCDVTIDGERLYIGRSPKTGIASIATVAVNGKPVAVW